ncbi:DUF3488 and transglutaminase-like domain-containing protein [Corynebacterium glyciniphilum]|uniref:DUF3488 and transglutaminase-like domain-containing protein n=1 Tax=Corynebacterium glyciniphilum TaxID=1404244 RepID=UPI003DA079C5
MTDRSHARPRLLVAGVSTTCLWCVIILALTEVFAPGAWMWRALSVCAVTLLVPTIAATFLAPRRDTLCLVAGVVAGMACSAALLAGGGRLGDWLGDPGQMMESVLGTVNSGSAPLVPTGPTEDLLMVVILLMAVATVVIIVGVGAPFGAGAVASLLLVVPTAVTGVPADRTLLLAAGVVLVVLAWIASPRISTAGFVSVAVAAAMAGTVVAVAPDQRDRSWNSSVLPSPVTGSVPDVTVSLAEDLRERSDTPAFRFSTDDAGPYRFTLATLADFEDGRWLPQEDLDPEERTVDQRRPEPGLDSDDIPARQVTVQIDGLRSEWLPLPQSGRQATGTGGESVFNPRDWRWTAESDTARSENTVTRDGDRYTVLATPLLSESLRDYDDRSGDGGIAGGTAGGYDTYLELPGELPAPLGAAAREAAGGASNRARPLSLGYALEEWFRDGGFVYDESAPYLPGSDPDDPYAVMEALLTERRGFCVHFASTFAVMARELGVPTRLAVGYASQASSGEETVVRAGELHAWPEILVDGLGWVAFEPTPGGAGGPGPAVDQSSTSSPTTPSSSSEAPAEDQGIRPDEETPPPPETDPAVPGERDQDDESSGPVTMLMMTSLILVGILALLLSPALVRVVERRVRRWRIHHGDEPARHAWAEMVDTAIDLGLVSRVRLRDRPLRARTPEAMVEYLATIGGLDKESAGAADRLAAAVSAERYGAKDQLADLAEIQATLAATVAGMSEHAGSAARRRAVFVPRSLAARGGRS